MQRLARYLAQAPATGVLIALLLCPLAVCGCQAHKTAPAQPAAVQPARPATLEEERAMLEQEKQELVGNYSENLERIQQINARIIDINIHLRQSGAAN